MSSLLVLEELATILPVSQDFHERNLDSPAWQLWFEQNCRALASAVCVSTAGNNASERGDFYRTIFCLGATQCQVMPSHILSRDILSGSVIVRVNRTSFNADMPPRCRALIKRSNAQARQAFKAIPYSGIPDTSSGTLTVRPFSVCSHTGTCCDPSTSTFAILPGEIVPESPRALIAVSSLGSPRMMA